MEAAKLGSKEATEKITLYWYEKSATKVDIEINNVGDSGSALNAAICYKSGGNDVDIDLVEA
ncbi:4351_t:CDS:2, partial [Cetraspora pellucida]